VPMFVTQTSGRRFFYCTPQAKDTAQFSPHIVIVKISSNMASPAAGRRMTKDRSV